MDGLTSLSRELLKNKKATTKEEVPFLPNSAPKEWPIIDDDLAFEMLMERGRLENVVIQDLGNVVKRFDTKFPDSFHISSCAIMKCNCAGLKPNCDFIISHSLFTEQVYFSSTYTHKFWLSFNRFFEYVQLRGSIFHSEVIFNASKFYRGIDIGYSEFKTNIQLKEIKFLGNRFQYGISLDGSIVNGQVDFTGAYFSRAAKLCIEGIDIRPGGKIILGIEQLGRSQRVNRRDGVVGTSNKFPRLKRIIPFSTIKKVYVKVVKSFRRKYPSVYLVHGEDLNEKEQLLKAAQQYNTLRDNFRGLPSKEEEEDRCHYKYKDLLRRGSDHAAMATFFDWFINKWCFGYLIYSRRILITGFGVVSFFALVYKAFYAFGGTDFICLSNNTEFNSLYFSMITFTTIGYGDFAPLGIVRYVAGVEGILGLTIMSLFTVSLARKIIR